MAIKLRNIKSWGNKGDGVRIGPGSDVDADGIEVWDNRGQGINAPGLDQEKDQDYEHSNKRRWYQNKIVIGITITIVGGLLLWIIIIALQHNFPSLSQ